MRRILLVGLLGAAACGDPVNVSGNYMVTLTNGANACSFPMWTVGNTTANVPFTITQNGGDVSGVVGGVAGVYVTFVLGSATFTGKVNGASLDLTLYGKNAMSQGSCAYTINARLLGNVMGDFLSGSIDYTAATNGAPDCGALTGCKTTQQYNGTRPPPAQ
jgi:hypothetical protein